MEGLLIPSEEGSGSDAPTVSTDLVGIDRGDTHIPPNQDVSQGFDQTLFQDSGHILEASNGIREQVRRTLDENGTLTVQAARGPSSCELLRCFKETDLSKDVPSTCEETLELLSECASASGENSVIVAAVPYAPLRVPSLAGDELFQEVSLNDDNLYKEKAGSGSGSHETDTFEVQLERPTTSSNRALSIAPSTSIKTASSGQLSSEVDICRICHLGREQSGAGLVSPCLCSGTVEFTHQLCLTRWLAECGAETCELCGYRFRFRNFTAFRPMKLKAIHVTHIDRLHLLLTLCTVLFLAGTAFYVFWVALSDNPMASRDRESMASQILLPIYATLDSMAIFIVIYELRNTVWRLWCKWRVLNLGVVIEDREARLRNNMADMDRGGKGRTGCKRPAETNQLIEQDHETEAQPYIEEDFQLRSFEHSLNDIFEPTVVAVENIIVIDDIQTEPSDHVQI